MATLIIHPKSKYYYIAYYDNLEPDPRKKRKRISTKIPYTKADLERFENKSGEKLQGNKEANELLKQIEMGLFQRTLIKKSSLKIEPPKKSVLLSEGFDEFRREHTRQGNTEKLKSNTIDLYKLAVSHLIKSTSDKMIHRYNKADFESLITHFDETNLSRNTRAIYTKHLHSLFEYFIKKSYTRDNIVVKLKEEIKERPEDIPVNDLMFILNYYKTYNPDRFNIIYFMLLTMSRPSSAILQEIKWIDFDKGFLEIFNAKVQRKQKPFYIYPLFGELRNHIAGIIKDLPGDAVRLFHKYPVNARKYTEPLKWWFRDQKRFHEAGKIKKPYELKQVRKTFPSFAFNELGMNEKDIMFLLDHSSEDVSRNYYINKKLDLITARMETKSFGSPVIDAEQGNLKLKTSPGKLNNLTKKELQKLILEKPITKIAEELGVSDGAIHKKCKVWNIKKPGKD